jgi:hypothetical protein
MKTGVIVYVTGDDCSMDPDEQKRFVQEYMKAHRVEIVSKNHGYNDISDAWWFLTAKGMQRIVCLMAEYTGVGLLKLTDRKLRLCG